MVDDFLVFALLWVNPISCNVNPPFVEVKHIGVAYPAAYLSLKFLRVFSPDHKWLTCEASVNQDASSLMIRVLVDGVT